jgi:hypothetical protein
VSAEVLLKPGEDRSRRSDGELLACDLEGERPEGVERGELADPRARAKSGCASITRARIGSAFGRNSRAVGLASASARAALLRS